MTAQLQQLYLLQERIMRARLARAQCLDHIEDMTKDCLRHERLVRAEQAVIKARRELLRQILDGADAKILVRLARAQAK